jgi:tetratricopeptide (TPR) repeat protein
MKKSLLLPLLSLVCSLSAAPFDDAAALLQSRKFPEAAAAFAALPADAGEKGQAAYLHALSLLLAEKSDEAVAAADRVPEDSPWALKAKFAKAAALTKAKKHQEAEAIYAAEATRAFSTQRRDVLVKALLEFADEAVNPVAAGEVNPPQPDYRKAAALCDKVLDMPITHELRADVLFKKANLLQKSGDLNAAHAAFNAWLLLFDPDWTLPFAGGKIPDRSGIKYIGQNREEARLHLTECLVATGRRAEARACAKELMAVLAQPRAVQAGSPAQQWAGDAAWLYVQTFAPLQRGQQPAQQMEMQQRQSLQNDAQQSPLPSPLPPGAQGDAGAIGSAFEQFANAVPFPKLPDVSDHSEDYLKELRAFLAAHAAHKAAPDAAEAIAHTLDQSDRSDSTDKPAQTIAAWTDFIEAKNFTFDANAEVNRKPDATTGQTPAEALLRRQQSAMFRIGQIHFEARRYTEAIAQWQKYIAAHPNGREWQQAQSGIVDAEFQSGLTAVAAGDEKKAREVFDGFLARYPLDARARQILFIYGQFHYAAGLALKGQPTDKTMPHFQNAITEWSRLIGKYPNTEESSLALYNTALILSDELGRLEDGLAAFKRVTWGQWAGPAKQRVELMSSKSLAVASERVFRLNETPAVKVSLRNIEKLKVSRYPLDVEAFFRSRHRMDAIDLLDIDLIAPDKTWEVAVKDFARFRSIQQEIPVEFPDGKPGAYVVRVEADDWQATTLLVRSDIDVLVESARREVLAYVHSADKKPVANATVLLSDGEKIIATGTTGADGVFRAKPEGMEKAGTVRAFVSTPQGMAGSFLELAGLALSSTPEKMARVFFDQIHYQPGDTVRWQAIRRDVRDGAFPVSAAGEGWKWRAQLPDGRLMYEGTIAWNPLGLCSGSFTLPPSAFDGDYKVRVFLNDTNSVQGNFTVREVGSLPALSVQDDFPQRSVLVGETVKGRYVVRWRNGLPAAGEKAALTYPDGRTEERTVDAQGMIPVEFTATKSGTGRFMLSFGEKGWHGENSQSFRPGFPALFHVLENEFTAAFAKLPEVVLAGEPFDLKTIARRFDAKPYAGALKLSVVRREAPKPSRVLEGVPWISGFTNSPADTPVSEVEIMTGDNGEAVQPVTLPQPGTYVLKLSGKDKQGHDITAETTLRAAGGDDDSKLRLVAPDVPLIAGQTLKLRVQSGFAHPNALVTIHAQEFFSHQLVALQAGANTLDLPVIAAHAPNFHITVAAMDGRDVHIASRPFEVRSGLKVTLTAEADGYMVKTTDLAGNPVAAHVITSAWSPGIGDPFRAAERIVIPTRATGLSIESSAAFYHTGASLRKQGEQFMAALNEQMMLCAVQEAEISFNGANTLLLDNNRSFVSGNYFLARADSRKHGVFVINPGLSAMKRDALGTDVKILTQGVPDIRWTEHGRSEAVAKAQTHLPGGSEGHRPAASQDLWSVLDTDATGTKKVGGLDMKDGLSVTACAVDGTSLVAADVLVVPSQAKLTLRALLPDVVTPGQDFSVPLLITNHGAATVENLTSQQIVDGRTSSVVVGPLPAGETRVSWHHGNKAPDQPGTTEMKFSAGGAEWRGTLYTRSLNVASVAPAGGLFAQGEHTLTLPGDEQITLDAEGKPLPAPIFRKAIGFRLITAADLALFPGASLNGAGELADMSEPQNAASELLHVLSAFAGAKEDSKAALRARLDLLAADLAVTEHEGGWAWENIDISPGLLTTAFTWRTLLEAKNAGVVVSDMMLKRTGAFVAGRYAGIGATDFERKATTLQAMAAAGKADFSLLNPLYRTRETLTPVALSRLCAAFIHAGREDEAKEVLAQLLKTGTAGKTAAGEDTLFWPGAKAVAGLNAPEESTAAALWCTAKLTPNAPEARRIALWLLNSQSTAPGGTTRCRGQVMQALAEYAKSLPRAAADDTVEVLADGQPAGPTGPVWPMPKDGKLTLRVKGAAPAVVIAAVVRETAPDDPKSWEYPKIGNRTYFHDNFSAGDVRLSSASTSPVTQAAYGQLINVTVKIQNHPDPTWRSHSNFLQVDEEIPAGCLFVEGSLSHNADRVDRHGNFLRLRYGPGTMEDITYQMIALTPGAWTAKAAVLADPYDPSRCRRGTANTLTILPAGTPSPDPYQMNRAEHLELARLTFAQNNGDECLKHLDAVVAAGRISQDEERDIARMRLWILAEKEEGDARALIGAFELLTERHPRLVIPFEKLLRAGAAYRRLNEFERAATVYRGALDGAFLQDSSLSAALEDAGDYIGGVDFQERLWHEFPDSKDVMDSLSGLAQSLSTKAPDAEKLTVRAGRPKMEKNALLTRSRDLLQRYITLYPGNDQADDAAFSLVNVFFSLKDYPGMVAAATAGAERHASGTFSESFKYMAALGWFWQGQFEKALAAAAPVANGESKDRDYARYVTAQVHHAQGQPAAAIEWYEKVKTVYEDAAEAIAWFEEKKVSLPEVSVFKPGEPVKLTLDYRNIKEGAVQLYKVDLMKLYLREKSLSNITRVNLAGIAPQAGESFKLGDGRDYAGKKKELTLPVKDDGAYLAIVRGDNLFTSGLILISPLKLEVKENDAGSVRVNVSDAASGKALADAEVKALGSSSQEVQSGTTDPRGVFEAGDISGEATVIVKQGENRYAFHRGTVRIGFDPPQIPQTFGGQGPANAAQGAFPVTPTTPVSGKPKVMSKGDYLKNIDESNKMLQQRQIDVWDTKRRGNAKGVEAGEALKK